ncbi:1764_t:CDS:2 [Paraglomus brasilianum]|uniref:1764_t:CDS:1 n=1 Tax=Paraglomus brasilianum TaxID=144538 RepID=A0A9N9CK95_9GLOM|nr:1764_t:CDS:2 [Paraglomus brasilianum]
MDLKGAIRFSTDSANFLSCNVVADAERHYLYVYATSNWQMIRKINIVTYVNDLRTASHPWTQIESVKSSLFGELFVSIEKWDVLSFWSMPECKLLARCRSSHFVDVDKRQTIFALSPNRKMLATWTPTKRLVIFLCKDGILFSSSMAPREHLGDRSESVRQLVWIGNKHVMIVDAVGGTKWNINTYDLISEYHDFGKMPIFKSTGEDVYATCDSDNNVPVIEELTDPDLTDSFDESTERLEGTTKLCRDKEGDFVLKFRCNVKGSSEKQTLSLRPTEFETTLHALYARKFLEFKDHIAHQIGPSHGLHLSKLLKQCEEIVYRTIRTNAQIFNANVDDRSMVHLLIDLDSTFADSMLEELLQKNVYIPLFYENKKSDKNEESDENQESDENKEPDENKKSALSCAILKGKAKVVEQEEKRRGNEKMKRGKIERKQQEESERLKGIVRDQYKEKKDAYRIKVCEIMQNFLTSLSASLDKETENSTVEKVAKEILSLRKDEFLDIESMTRYTRYL